MATSDFRKQYNAAPKYVLGSLNEGDLIYVNNRKKVTDSKFTTDITKALKFSVGFDDDKIKAKAWSISTGLNFTAINI